MHSFDSNRVVIIGGGAAGCAAAIIASRDESNRVTVLERQSRTGRKLLSTGNGRCNITNMNAAPEAYFSVEEHPAAASFTAPALDSFNTEKTLEFFRGLGLVTKTEPSGRVYPLSDQANSVADVLRFALARPNVELKTGLAALSVSRKKDNFAINTDEGEIPANRLIIACGGAAGAKVGGVSDGYALLQGLGHSRTRLYPSLTQLKTETAYPRALKGVKADAGVALMSGGLCLCRRDGEVLFTEYGVSGPAVFDISRAAAIGGAGLVLELDFLREMSAGEAYALLSARRAAEPELTAENLLTGVLHNRLGRMVCKYAGLALTAELGSLKDGELRAVAAAAKAFRLPVSSAVGFDSAQVTAGGVRLGEFRPETLESRLVPGLFACGEVLDVDGPCGGYNLQWAWASGMLAGRLGK